MLFLEDDINDGGEFYFYGILVIIVGCDSLNHLFFRMTSVLWIYCMPSSTSLFTDPKRRVVSRFHYCFRLLDRSMKE